MAQDALIHQGKLTNDKGKVALIALMRPFAEVTLIEDIQRSDIRQSRCAYFQRLSCRALLGLYAVDRDGQVSLTQRGFERLKNDPHAFYDKNYILTNMELEMFQRFFTPSNGIRLLLKDMWTVLKEIVRGKLQM